MSEEIKPIVCIGEPLEFRKNKSYLKFLEKQLNECVPECSEIIIAYEPIWSIGTGLVPDYEEIYEVQNYVKSFLKNNKFIKKISVLYGGSVSSNNIAHIIKKSHFLDRFRRATRSYVDFHCWITYLNNLK